MIILMFGTGQNCSPAEINRGTVLGQWQCSLRQFNEFTSAAEEKAIAQNAALVEKFGSAGEM